MKCVSLWNLTFYAKLSTFGLNTDKLKCFYTKSLMNMCHFKKNALLDTESKFFMFVFFDSWKQGVSRGRAGKKGFYFLLDLWLNCIKQEQQHFSQKQQLFFSSPSTCLLKKTCLSKTETLITKRIMVKTFLCSVTAYTFLQYI